MFNKAFLLGRIGKKVKLAYTKDACPVASFDMATNEYYKDKNGERGTDTGKVSRKRHQCSFKYRGRKY